MDPLHKSEALSFWETTNVTVTIKGRVEAYEYSDGKT